MAKTTITSDPSEQVCLGFRVHFLKHTIIKAVSCIGIIATGTLQSARTVKAHVFARVTLAIGNHIAMCSSTPNDTQRGHFEVAFARYKLMRSI
jgi:hypothetical protein